MTDKIVIELPDKKFMNVKMHDGKAEIMFSDTCQIDGNYNLEIKPNNEIREWTLPVEK